MWTVIGFVLFFVALLLSIALHELGHLSFAKLFKVRTTQYMVGFGKTLWSRQVGETEYGVKAVPLGGYIRMVGMVPPGPDGAARTGTTAFGPAGIIRNIIEETREGDRAQITAADEGRQFYQLHPFKRIVIMTAGPVMNLLIAVGVFAILLVGIGVQTPVPTVKSVNACVLTSAEVTAGRTCTSGDPQSPAAAAGLQPGDTITAINGISMSDWTQVQQTIQASAGVPLTVAITRGGQSIDLTVNPQPNEIGVYDNLGQLTGTRTVGFIGFTPTTEFQTQSVGAAFQRTGDFIGAAAQGIVNIPARIPALWDSVFNGAPRGLDSPMGIVGAGRVGGEILETSNLDAKEKLVTFLNLIAGFNMALFLLNMLPLLPLDGGHILGAVIEWVRRGWAKIRGKKAPGPFDVAKLMPVGYVVAIAFIGLTVLTLAADIINPVTLFN